MLVIMKNDATEAQVQAVIKHIENLGFRGIPIPGACERRSASSATRVLSKTRS